MAIPSYTTDLTTLAIGSITVDAGTWDESSNAAWDDAGSMVDDGNLYYNGAACVSAQFTKDGVGTIMYEHTSSVTIPADGALLIHHMWAAPPALASLADGGVRILIGNGFGVFYSWDISGNDFAPAPKGGWTNYAVNPGIGSPDDTVGSPATPYDTFGMAVSATAQARGNPNACNAVRYGRCESIFTDGDIGNGYCTFEGYGDTDSLSANKWSLIDPVEGGYKYQGLMSIGSTGTSVDFRDSNVNISIANTINVTSGFNAIEINNASSNVEWTAINITALGTVSIGTFEVVDNATLNKTSCTFTDMGTFVYQSNSTLTDTIYRRCGLITQDGASFDGCTFDNTTAAQAVTADSLIDISDCNFISDGSSYAVDLGTIATTSSVTWANYISGYETYSAGGTSTGNEAILVSVSSGETLTINVSTGYDTPSFNNVGLGSVSVVNSVTLEVNGVKTGTEPTNYVRCRIEKTSDGTQLMNEEAQTSYGSDGFYKAIESYAFVSDLPVTIRARYRGYLPFETTGIITSAGLTVTAVWVADPNYI